MFVKVVFIEFEFGGIIMSEKMTKCKSCGNDIAASAKACPNCGAKNSKPIFKKWWFWVIIVVLLIAVIGASGGDDSGDEATNTPSGNNSVSQAVVEASKDNELGLYQVEIKNARITKNWEGKPAVVITYGFTNNADEPVAFWLAFEDDVYQGGVGLEKAYTLRDGDPYDEANQNKEIKNGVSIDVDVAYVLNDTETDIEVEVKELYSFSDDVVSRVFSIK